MTSTDVCGEFEPMSLVHPRTQEGTWQRNIFSSGRVLDKERCWPLLYRGRFYSNLCSFARTYVLLVCILHLLTLWVRFNTEWCVPHAASRGAFTRPFRMFHNKVRLAFSTPTEKITNVQIICTFSTMTLAV